MDTSKIEEILADLESKSCCGRVKLIQMILKQ